MLCSAILNSDLDHGRLAQEPDLMPNTMPHTPKAAQKMCRWLCPDFRRPCVGEARWCRPLGHTLVSSLCPSHRTALTGPSAFPYPTSHPGFHPLRAVEGTQSLLCAGAYSLLWSLVVSTVTQPWAPQAWGCSLDSAGETPAPHHIHHHPTPSSSPAAPLLLIGSSTLAVLHPLFNLQSIFIDSVTSA